MSDLGAFGHWLAGFIDGEGCFIIQEQDGNYSTSLRIGLRDDDRPLLEELVSRLGIGKVNIYKRSASQWWDSKPQARWYVGSKGDCRRLVEILDAHPLRSKKARDYAIWREAVLLWCSCQTRPGRSSLTPAGYHERMEALREQLNTGRQYAAPQVTFEPLTETHLQLRLSAAANSASDPPVANACATDA